MPAETKLLITIDGPAGAGKTTASRRLAARLGYRHIDTGALYRAVAYAARARGIDPEDDAALGRLLAALAIQFTLLIVGLFVPAIAFPARVAIKLAIFALLPFGFILLGIISPAELKHIGVLVRERILTRGEGRQQS